MNTTAPPPAAFIAFAAGQWRAGLWALLVRILAGMVVGYVVVQYRRVMRDFWMIPLRDLFGFAVWLGGLFGSNVLWRGKRLRLRPDGRIGG